MSGDSVAELQRVMGMSSLDGCITRGLATKESVKWQFVCGGGAKSATTAIASIKDIKLQKFGPHFRVLVTHKDGRPDFAFHASALADAETFAMHLASLHARRFDAASTELSSPTAQQRRSTHFVARAVHARDCSRFVTCVDQFGERFGERIDRGIGSTLIISSEATAA